jgi:hypothetical protein
LHAFPTQAKWAIVYPFTFVFQMRTHFDYFYLLSDSDSFDSERLLSIQELVDQTLLIEGDRTALPLFEDDHFTVPRSHQLLFVFSHPPIPFSFFISFFLLLAGWAGQT